MIKKLILSVALLLTFTGLTVKAAEWEIDQSHSNIGFKVKHMMVSTVHGSFGEYTATVYYDETRPEELSVETKIEVASIDTRNAKRDEHLRGADFFEVDKYPRITFKSRQTESMGKGKFRVTGDLIIHGVTKEIVLVGEGFTPVIKSPWGSLVTAVHAEATINRTDFGLTWNKAIETGGILVGDLVTIELDLELIKK